MQETSREALASIDAGSIREKVYGHILAMGHHGTTDDEIEVALTLIHQTASARRRELVQAHRVIDSGRRRPTRTGRNAIVWVTDRKPAMEQPREKPGRSTQSEHIVATPPKPLPVGSKGQAMAIAAFALQALSGHVHRVHWCVDLKKHVGIDADSPLNPSDPENVHTKWGQYLGRFADGLNLQRWGPYHCNLAMSVRHTLQSSGATVITTFDMPWSAHLPSLCRADPPVGVWRLHVCPPHRIDPYDNRPMHSYEGDQYPDSFWYDGIPF